MANAAQLSDKTYEYPAPPKALNGFTESLAFDSKLPRLLSVYRPRCNSFNPASSPSSVSGNMRPSIIW